MLARVLAWLQTHWRSLTLLSVTAVACAFIVGSTDAVERCINEPHHGHPQQSASNGFRVVRPTVVSWHCLGVFLDDDDKALVALATIGLLLVTGALAWYTARLWTATRDLARDAKDGAAQQSTAMENQRVVMAAQQRAMSEQVAAMHQQGVAMERQATAMEQQARAMETQGLQLVQSIRLAEAEFVATHRPRLRVRNVVVGDRPGDDGQILPSGIPLTGQFYCANVGDTEATVTESGCWVCLRSGDLPMRRPYEGATGNAPIAKLTTIKAGVSVPGVFGSDERILSTDESNAIIDGRGLTLWVLGWIEYRDAEATPRRTTFCRRFDPEKRRFVRVDDPDYEHEE